MFKIYSLVLLSFLYLQNINAADQREEFPGEETMKRRMVAQQRAVEDLQPSLKKVFQEASENPAQLSSSISSPALEGENPLKDKEFTPSTTLPIKLIREIKKFESELDFFKTELYKSSHHSIEERRFETIKLKKENEIKEYSFKEKLQKEATKYRQLGITPLLKSRDEENLPSQERNPCASLCDFPLTFDHPDKSNNRIYLKLSEEDQKSLRASGVNHELINNLFSHLQTDVSALCDMIQRGYRTRQEQNRQ